MFSYYMYSYIKLYNYMISYILYMYYLYTHTHVHTHTPAYINCMETSREMTTVVLMKFKSLQYGGIITVTMNILCWIDISSTSVGNINNILKN